MSKWFNRKKEATNIINDINRLISLYGSPVIMQCNNGLEFKNNKLKKYCIDDNIKLLFNSSRHLTINGVVERLNQEIIKALYAEKLSKKIIKIVYFLFPML